MAKGRWKVSSEKAAAEAFLVLIRGQRATKRYPKRRLQAFLVDLGIRSDFLRLCFEFDDTDGLVHVRKGLLLAIQALGPSKVARYLKVNRVSVYRMLSPQGNPSLRYIVRLLDALGLRLWAVDADFISRREVLERPKDVAKDLDAFEVWMDKVYFKRNKKRAFKERVDDEL